jgi:hypothetical protein
MSYTTSVDPTDSQVTLVTLGLVTFRVRGADLPGAIFVPPWTSQIDQIAAGLAVIPSTHHASIAIAEIRVVRTSGGGTYNFRTNLITVSNERFRASWNRVTFQTLIHECGHAYDDHMHCTARIRNRNSAGRARERVWTNSLPAPIANWTPGVSPTFPAASPPDEWDHFRAIPYRGSNRVRQSGLPGEIESFAEGFMMYLCRRRALTPAQVDLFRSLAAF